MAVPFTSLGKGGVTKSDEFSEKFQMGGAARCVQGTSEERAEHRSEGTRTC